MQNLYEAIVGKKNRNYYLAKFESFDRQGPGLKPDWSWPAFFCGGVWALYRKMYGWFFAFWGIAFLSSIFDKAASPGISAIVFLALWLTFTIYANSLYHHSIKKKISFAQITLRDEPKLLEYLRHKGGVHTWVIWVFGGLPVIGVVAAILLPIFARQMIDFWAWLFVIPIVIAGVWFLVANKANDSQHEGIVADVSKGASTYSESQQKFAITPAMAKGGQARVAKSDEATTKADLVITNTGEANYHLYEIAANELETRNIQKGVWAKAFSDADGDEKNARARYIKLRVQQLVSGVVSDNGTSREQAAKVSIEPEASNRERGPDEVEKVLANAKSNPDAAHALGRRYYHGVDIAKDRQIAFKLFEAAAEAGNKESQYNLGVILEDGDGVQQDEKGASYWYIKAAGNNSQKAMNRLGAAYLSGELGLNKDKSMSDYWYAKARNY